MYTCISISFSYFHLKSEWAKGDKTFSLTRLSNCDHSIDKPIIEKYLALVKTYSEMNNIIENVKPLGIKALVRNHSKYVQFMISPFDFLFFSSN